MVGYQKQFNANTTNVFVRADRKSATMKIDAGSIFKAMTANETLLEAQKLPNPRKLWKEFWVENEVCCLFADSNVGKSVLAVQIATEIARTEKVLYYDFEQSDKQFQLRYTDSNTGQTFNFPKNLMRLTLTGESISALGDRMEDVIMSNIERDVHKFDARILIIDNISWLMNAKNSTETAANLMTKLVALKKKCGLSILVLAHTKKRPSTKPIDQNDLAGSKRLINFFDAAFTIGKSMSDSELRYVKQIKVRTGKYTYDSDHVMLCTIEQKNSFLQFVQQDFGDEADHLKIPKQKEKMEQIDLVSSLKAHGLSVRQIAEATGLSKSKVGRLLLN